MVEVTWDESEQLPQVAPLQLSPLHCGILLGLDDSGDKQSGCGLSNKKYIWGPSCKSSSLKKYFNVLFHSQEASGWNQINSLSDVRGSCPIYKVRKIEFKGSRYGFFFPSMVCRFPVFFLGIFLPYRNAVTGWHCCLKMFCVLRMSTSRPGLSSLRHFLLSLSVLYCLSHLPTCLSPAPPDFWVVPSCPGQESLDHWCQQRCPVVCCL